MKQYIEKSALVAEVDKWKEDARKGLSDYAEGVYDTCEKILSFLNTLEVKEVYECNNVDLNPLFEEMGVEPDSRIALMFKNAFYKSVDKYLDKKEDKL